jgi:hypothetical protein
MEPSLWPGGPPLGVAMMIEEQRQHEARARALAGEQRREDEFAAVVLQAAHRAPPR